MVQIPVTVDFNSPDDEQRFLAEKPSWLRKCLQGNNTLTPEEKSEMGRCNWLEVSLQAEDEYLEVLKRYPEKLKAYREREAKSAAKTRLLTIPSVPAGAPRGMRKETRKDAHHLIQLIEEFEKKNGTRRGAWDYATKKVYGSEGNQHARIERGKKAVRRFNKVQKSDD